MCKDGGTPVELDKVQLPIWTRLDARARGCRTMIANMPEGWFLQRQFDFAEMFNPLQLNDAEIAIFTAIRIMNPGG